MYFLKKFILSVVLPPARRILLVLAGIVLPRYRPFSGKVIVGVLMAGFLVLSTPWVAGALMERVQKYPPINKAQLATCQAIVVLGGGIYRRAPGYDNDTIGRVSLERLRHALYLSNRSGLPVFATGGAPEGGLSEALARRQIAETNFGGGIQWVEDQPPDTGSSALLLAILLQGHHVGRVALVSHGWHLPRAVAKFEAAGLTVVSAPMGGQVQRSMSERFSLVQMRLLSLAAPCRNGWAFRRGNLGGQSSPPTLADDLLLSI